VTQGLSDKNGIYQILASQNEEFINITVNKDGFYPVQRTYVREIQSSNVVNSNNKDSLIIEKTWKTESDTIKREVFVYLVKESFVIENSLMLFFTYSNAFDDNFLPVMIETKMPDNGIFLKNYIYKQ